jgi:hypothetical protein
VDLLFISFSATGLDAAVSKDVMLVLKEWVQVSGGTVIAALLQATPECFALYDDLILMKEGQVLYHGPRVDVAAFMEQSWGLTAPEDMDLADFIIEVLTNPVQQFRKQARAHAHGKVQRKFALHPSLPKELEHLADGETNGSPHPLLTNGHANGNGHTNGNGNGTDGAYLSDGRIASPSPKEDSVSHVRFHLGAAEEQEPLVEQEGQEPGASAVAPSNAPLQTVAQGRATAQASARAVAAAALSSSAVVGPLSGDDALPLLARQQSNWPVTTDALVAAYKRSAYYLLQRASVERVQSERPTKLQQAKSDKAQLTPYTLAQYGHLYTRGFATHTRLSLRRQFTLLSRDKQTVPPRAFSAILQSLIFGSLFFRLASDNFFPKIGILLFSIMFFAMGNFTELVRRNTHTRANSQIHALCPPMNERLAVKGTG